MPSYERGVYEPADDVRVFDGAEDEDDAEGSRLSLLIVIALIVLALFGSVVYLAYQRGVANGRTEPRLLMAEEGPAKIAAANPSGTGTPLTGLKIYNQQAGNEEETDKAAPGAAKSAAAAPMPSVSPATKRQPAVAKVKPAMSTLPVQAAQIKPAGDRPLRTAQAELLAPAPATAPPKPLTPPAPAASAESAQTAAPATGGYVLQIGAYKSQGEADDSWNAFREKHSALVAGFSSDIRKVEISGKGTWYRLRLGSFADKDAATALCERLKADGGNCFLAK